MPPAEASTASSFPTLEVLPQSALESSTFQTPVKLINEGHHVHDFLRTRAWADIGKFVLQLNHALCPRTQPSSDVPRTFPLVPGSSSSTPSIQALQGLLSKLDDLIDLAPPDPGPRRFGNVSFRTWHGLMEEKLDSFLSAGRLGETLSLKGKDGVCAKDEVSSYLMGAFGSSQRLDYGTGHELSFVAFLGCLWKLGFFQDGQQGGDIEREIVLKTFESYLKVVRRLILTYTLEPAGSHGVWGLDDHSFIPYIFGSAQLTQPISSESEPMPVEGSVRGAPKPSDVTKAAVVESQRLSNIYFSSIGFINDVKKGPFWEHSPILFDISGIKAGWGKINKGMIKMFNAEVLSKFPVIQHFPFGSLFSWDIDPSVPLPPQSIHMQNQPAAKAASSSQPASGMPAPWTQATRMPVPVSAGSSHPRAPPGPHSGSLPARQATGEQPAAGSTSAQITITKAPWAA